MVGISEKIGHTTTQYILLILIMGGVLFFSLRDFLVEPAYWFDEAITIEIARNFYLFGELDILTAPDTFSGVPYIAGTNGYPLTLPLAAFFAVAGYGLAEARIFMLFWLITCLFAVYFVTKKIFGVVPAFAALLLVATFASFYGNGLTATGEIPGFLFFLFALFLAAHKKDYMLAGVCAGLAMAAKPGVYLFLAHAVVLFILLVEQGERVKSFLRFGAGLIPPIIIWILLAFPLSMDTFFSTAVYAVNPLDIPVLRNLFDAPEITNLNTDLIIPSSESALANIQGNILLLLTSSTGVYFLLMSAAVFFAYLVSKKQQTEQRRFMQISLIYGVLALAYFLRGPGWIRYLFGFQILFLILLFPSLTVLKEKIKIYSDVRRHYGFDYLLYIGIILLVAAQTYHLLYLSNVPRSQAALRLVSYTETQARENPALTLGLVNVPEVAAFSDPARIYHMIWLQRTMPPFGTQFFTEGTRPDLVITDGKNFLLGEAGEKILQGEYQETTRFGRYRIYERL